MSLVLEEASIESTMAGPGSPPVLPVLVGLQRSTPNPRPGFQLDSSHRGCGCSSCGSSSGRQKWTRFCPVPVQQRLVWPSVEPNVSQTHLTSLVEFPVDASEVKPPKPPQPGRKLCPSISMCKQRGPGPSPGPGQASDCHSAGYLLVVDDEVRVALVIVEDDVDLRVHPVVYARVKEVTGGVTGVDGWRPPHGGVPHREPANPEKYPVNLAARF